MQWAHFGEKKHQLGEQGLDTKAKKEEVPTATERQVGWGWCAKGGVVMEILGRAL